MPTIAAHGRSANSARVSAETLLAASPTTSIARTSANDSMRSLSRSLRLRPAINSSAAFMACNAWRRRTRSCGFILDLGLAHDFVTEIAAEVFRRPHVHTPSAEQRRQLHFDIREVEEGGRSVRLE